MKTLTVLTFAASLCLASLAFAQDSADSLDKSDHYNNQSSIVPDTVPDKVTHDQQNPLPDKASRDAARNVLENDRQDKQSGHDARTDVIPAADYAHPAATH